MALLITALQSILAGGTVGAAVPLEELGEPFYSVTLQVEWKVATNPLPATVTIFKVVPVSFSPAVISNVVRLCSSSSTDSVQSLGSPTKLPNGALRFQSPDGSSGLSIVPAEGLVVFYAPGDHRPPFQNVPDKTRAFELGTNILKQLPVPSFELQTGADQKPHALFGAGTYTHRGISERCDMRVVFCRKLDEIPCDDEELRIHFGVEERITQLELRWHGVRAVKSCPVATKEQMMAWIREGRARVLSLVTTGMRGINVSEIKRLIIKRITLHYSAATYLSGGEYVSMDRLYPYAVLEAEVELGPGDTETCYLFCPVTDEGLNRASHKSGEFGVYPSKLLEKRMQEEKDRHAN
jgi:hypothetical protein